MLKESGTIFFADEYQQQYNVDWETIGTDIDITTITKTPYVLGEDPVGFVKNGILFRRGTVSVERQIIRILDNGYEIIAEGSSSFEEFIQMNYPCGGGPTDPFTYHLNCGVLDDVYIKVLEGPHWADPDDPDDSDTVWGDVESDGSPVEDLTGTGGLDILTWIDVWE